jgi:predicted nucleic acid-binding OB-fold protein
MLQYYKNIKVAVSLDINNSIPQLFQLLGYRKRVAEEMLKNHNEEEFKALKDIFERVNNDIKLLLGLTDDE